MPETSLQVEQERALTGWQLAREEYPLLNAEAQNKTARYLGGIILQSEVVIEYNEEANSSTLLAAVQLAALGDAGSRKVVSTNVVTDLSERLFKAGHQTSVQLSLGKNGLEQTGRSLVDIHTNTLKYSKLNEIMKNRTLQELENTALFNELLRAGVLSDHNAVVFSPTPDDEQTKKDYGFFNDTSTCSVQFLRCEESDIVLETALVAGRPAPGLARHDVKAIQTIAKDNGVEIMAADADEFLRYILLVPKELTINGVADIVKQYDQALGGTFYGQLKDNPAISYEAYARHCNERNQNLGPVAGQITEQLIAEAHNFKTPLYAIKRLDELSELYGVSYAVKDNTIQSLVFGAEAAGYIEQARIYAQNGDTDMYEKMIIDARRTAKSSSCPLFKSSSDSLDKNSTDDDIESNGQKKWMKCPYCRADKYGDPCAKILECGGCKAKVVNGKVMSKGNGGEQTKKIATTLIFDKPKKQLAKV